MNRRKFIKFGILGTIGLSFLDAFWFERYIIDWNYFDISKKKEDKIKIIQISDLHIQSIKSFHKSIARKINKLKPDFVCITGDAVDKNENTYILNDFLNLLDKQINKVAITGNWEYWGKINLIELNEIYQKHNCDFLINENKSYNIRNQKINIIGVDDYVGGNPNYEKSITDLKTADKNIALIHCPAFTDKINTNNLDLILSGHTHGGQINFFGFVPFKPQGSGSYLKGLYKNSKMYVSKGIGTSLLPIRFGARAEVVEIDV